ncbi:hypothetical protein H5410_045041 [Solanum commersonii]|uniref:DCD domain-containing protein n=1 Tax=Solanum commersonii TaxID=4109 RepID=A0A9J5XAD7_SOLCO|nr:hypothetical protein H5410_045041 [Solanum commersonii]
MPTPQFSYVKNIDLGLPLFLFNYSNRKLHGIYEATSSGKMNINPYGWTLDGSGRNKYPTHVRNVCKQPLAKLCLAFIIQDNYYNDQHHFMFELDRIQTANLISKLSSLCIDSNFLVSIHKKRTWRSN